MIEEKLINKLKTMEGFNKGIMAEVMVLPHNLYSLIFSHSFAKAFWGEENHSYDNEGTCNTCQCYTLSDTLYCWQYYLQQMVLEEEPLKYLEKFL